MTTQIQILELCVGDAPGFVANRDGRRFRIGLDGSAVMKLCGDVSYDLRSKALAAQADRVARAADRLLSAAGSGIGPDEVMISALDLD